MTIRTISPSAVQALIAKGGPVDLIDVRTSLEYQAVHAIGAEHAPLSNLNPATVMANRRGGKSDPIYIICKSGARSASACGAFIAAGYANVYSVEGGTDSWAAAGLPVERNAKAATAGVLRQFVIMGAVFVAFMLLMPCSSWSIWGNAWCPTKSAPAGPPSSATASTQSAGSALSFDRDVIAASKTTPVLVDFNATWCGPCKMLGPELDQLAEQRVGKLVLVKIDVDQYRDLAMSQGIQSIPDVRLWKDGREVGRFMGYRSPADVTAWLDSAIANKTP